MKIKYLIFAAAFVMACNSDRSTDAGQASDTVSTNADQITTDKRLFARMQMDKNQRDSVILNFSVYNPADTPQKFCKWHTPFEPLLSKYLSVTDDQGKEAAYSGPMAKRVMPPPPDSYITVNGKENMSVSADLLAAYRLKKGKRYTVRYTGDGVSGLAVPDTVSFEYR